MSGFRDLFPSFRLFFFFEPRTRRNFASVFCEVRAGERLIAPRARNGCSSKTNSPVSISSFVERIREFRSMKRNFSPIFNSVGNANVNRVASVLKRSEVRSRNVGLRGTEDDGLRESPHVGMTRVRSATG